jgi:hypothetical protein
LEPTIDKKALAQKFERSEEDRTQLLKKVNPALRLLISSRFASAIQIYSLNHRRDSDSRPIAP